MPDITTVLLIFLGVLNFLCLVALFQVKNELDSSREVHQTQVKAGEEQTKKVLEQLVALKDSLDDGLSENQVATAHYLGELKDDLSHRAITLDTQLKDLAALIPSARFSDNNFKVPVQRVNADGTTTVELREPIKPRSPIKDEKLLEELHVNLWRKQ